MAAQLQMNCAELDNSITTSSTSAQNNDDQKLRDLSKKVLNTAKELISGTSKLSVQGPPSKRKAFGKAFKTLWRQSAVDDIQKRLDHYQRLLDTHIIVNLR